MNIQGAPQKKDPEMDEMISVASSLRCPKFTPPVWSSVGIHKAGGFDLGKLSEDAKLIGDDHGVFAAM